MMMPDNEVYAISPNRIGDHRTWTPLEVIENFISKVPEMDVKFGEWTDNQEDPMTFKLKTSLAADPQTYEQVSINMGTDMDDLVQLIGTELRNYNFKPKIDRVYIDVNPGTYTYAGPNSNGQRMVMYTVEGAYNLTI